MALIKDKNPYKGLDSYKVKDRDRFYGRDEEKKKLLRLVKNNSVTVVFGKSGVGKTSLLNAGVLPDLKEEGFLPIKLRLNYNEPTLLVQAREIIRSELKENDIQEKYAKGNFKGLQKHMTLWEYFHRAEHFDNVGKKITPVLILDQFEEMFSIGKGHKELNDWINELFYLIEDEFPEDLRKRMLKGEEEFPYTPDPPNLRIIISLREDYLSHLISLKDHIHSIDRVMFQVKHLDGQKARKIINMPDGIQDVKVTDNILLLFYPDDAEECTEIPNEQLEVEPSLLSLICYQIMEEKKDEFFTKEDKDRILNRFYDSALKGLPTEVEVFIEENLLTKEGGFRTLFRLERKNPLGELLHQLVERRILRKVYLGEKAYIEITHNVLTSIIRERRNKRLDKIRKQRLRKKYIRNLRIRVISGVAIILALFLWYALNQRSRANEQYRDAQVNRLIAEAIVESSKNNTRAIRIVEEAYKMGLPNPPPRTSQILSDIGYSSFEKPFYITDVHHKGEIYKAVFSPDGSKILTASEDCTAKLWDLEGKTLAELKHKARVFSAVFSPDGKQILTASWDGTARLWDLKGNVLTSLEHNEIVFSAVFSLDGSRILTASRDGFAKIWSLGGRLIKDFKHNEAVSSAVFSPDGKRILTASWDKVVRIWNMDGIITKSFEFEMEVSSAVFSPDGNRILISTKDGTAKVWPREGKPIVLKHDKKISSAEFSPDGNLIITALEDGTANLWNINGDLIANKKMNNKALSSAVFSPDGLLILTASLDGTAKVWNMKDEPLVVDLIKYKGQLSSAVLSPDGKKILTAYENDGTAREWDLEGKLITVLRHKGAVFSAAYSPDGSRILTVSEGGAAKIWSLEEREWKVIADLKQHIGIVTSAVFTPDGQRILTTSGGKDGKVWDLEGNPLTLRLSEVASSAVFTPDGQRILTTSRDNRANLWNLKGELLKSLDHTAVVSCAFFSPDGQRIITASVDGTAKLWNLQGNLLANPDGHTAGVNNAVFSADGLRILTASRDGTAKLWDLEGNLLADLDRHTAEVKAAVFSPDGQRILTASGDGIVKIWYTPEAIYQWLKSAKIPHLSREDKKRLGLL